MSVFTQLDKTQWIKGDYREVAAVRIASQTLAERHGFTLETYEEDGLGEAHTAGFLTANGRPFAIVEYVNSPARPLTYFLCLHQLETVTNDLREALTAFGLKASDLYGVYDFIDRKGLEDETSSPD